MKTTLLGLIIAALVFIYGATLFAVLHPRVSEAYKAYYINHISREWEFAGYSGTPEQGIVFSRNGLPNWVQFAFGLSYPEGWGRWTDKNLDSVAGLVFNRNFSGQLCVDFTVRAVPWVVGKTFAVRMGGQTHFMQIAGTDLTQYQVQFTNLPPSDRLELLIPEKLPRVFDITPTNRDMRRLALNLSTLRIVPGACSAANR
jgi:hypothetical protein